MLLLEGESSHSGDSFGASYQNQSFTSDPDGSSDLDGSSVKTFNRESSHHSHSSSANICNASMAETPRFPKEKTSPASRVTEDVRHGKERQMNQKHIESPNSPSGSFPDDGSNGNDVENSSSKGSHDSRMSVMDAEEDDSISSSSRRSRSAHSSSFDNNGSYRSNRSFHSHGTNGSSQHRSFSSRHSVSHATSEESRRIVENDPSSKSHDGSSSRRSEQFGDDNEASLSSRSNRSGGSAARSVSSSSKRSRSLSSSKRSVPMSDGPGDSWHSHFSGDGPPDASERSDADPSAASQRSGSARSHSSHRSVQFNGEEEASFESKQSAGSARSRGSSSSDASRSTARSNAERSSNEPMSEKSVDSWHSHFSDGQQKEVYKQVSDDAKDDGSLSSRRTGSAHSNASSQKRSVQSNQCKSSAPIVSEHSMGDAGTISEPGGSWHSTGPETSGRKSPSVPEDDLSQAINSSRSCHSVDADLSTDGSSRRSSVEEKEDANPTWSKDSDNSGHSSSSQSLSKSKRSCGDQSPVSRRGSSGAASDPVSFRHTSSTSRDDAVPDDSDLLNDHSSSTKFSARSDSSHSSRRSVSVHSAIDSRGSKSISGSESTAGRSFSSRTESARPDDVDTSISGRSDKSQSRGSRSYSPERSKSVRENEESSLSTANCDDDPQHGSERSASPISNSDITQTNFIDESVQHHSTTGPKSTSSGPSGTRVLAGTQSPHRESNGVWNGENRDQSPEMQKEGSPVSSPSASFRSSQRESSSHSSQGSASMSRRSMSRSSNDSAKSVVRKITDELETDQGAQAQGHHCENWSESATNSQHPDDSERLGRLTAAFDLYENNYLNTSSRSISESNEHIVDASGDAFDRILSETKKIVGLDGENDQDFFYESDLPNERQDHLFVGQESVCEDAGEFDRTTKSPRNLVNRSMSKFESSSLSRPDAHYDRSCEAESLEDLEEIAIDLRAAITRSCETEHTEDLEEIAKELRAVIAQLPVSNAKADPGKKGQVESTRDMDSFSKSPVDDRECSLDLASSGPAEQDCARPDDHEKDWLSPAEQTSSESHVNFAISVVRDDSPDNDTNSVLASDSKFHENGQLFNSTSEIAESCVGAIEIEKGMEESESVDDPAFTPENDFSESSRLRSASHAEIREDEESTVEVNSERKTDSADDVSVGNASDEGVIGSVSKQMQPLSPSQSTGASCASSRSCSDECSDASHTSSVSSSRLRHRDSEESQIIDSGKAGIIDDRWLRTADVVLKRMTGHVGSIGDSVVANSPGAERKASSISQDWMLSADQAMQKLLSRGLSVETDKQSSGPSFESMTNSPHNDENQAAPTTFQTTTSLKRTSIDNEWLKNADDVLRRITKRVDDEGNSTPVSAFIHPVESLELELESIHRRPDKSQTELVDKDWLTNADALLQRIQSREMVGNERNPPAAEPDRNAAGSQRDDSMSSGTSESSETKLSTSDNQSSSSSADLEENWVENTRNHVDKEWLEMLLTGYDGSELERRFPRPATHRMMSNIARRSYIRRATVQKVGELTITQHQAVRKQSFFGSQHQSMTTGLKTLTMC
jgi:hypothetical protein